MRSQINCHNERKIFIKSVIHKNLVFNLLSFVLFWALGTFGVVLFIVCHNFQSVHYSTRRFFRRPVQVSMHQETDKREKPNRFALQIVRLFLFFACSMSQAVSVLVYWEHFIQILQLPAPSSQESSAVSSSLIFHFRPALLVTPFRYS